MSIVEELADIRQKVQELRTATEALTPLAHGVTADSEKDMNRLRVAAGKLCDLTANLLTEEREGRLTSTERHDLRTPLNHLLGYTELLMEDLEDSGAAELCGGLKDLNTRARAVLDFVERRLKSLNAG